LHAWGRNGVKGLLRVLRPHRLGLPVLRTGLVGRLVFAFTLVVLLVVIANIAATNVGIIRMTARHDPPVIFQPRSVPAVARSPTAGMPAPASDRSLQMARIASFLGALGTFERAVDRRAAGAAPGREDELNRAAAGLSQQSALLETDHSSSSQSRKETGPLLRHVRELTAYSRAWVEQGDARRQASLAYWEGLDALDTELKSALDRTWKILGRVIARESLLDMNRRADEIRRLSSRVVLANSVDASSDEELARAQSTLATQLDGLIARNGTSKSGAWTSRARMALDTTIEMRLQLARVTAADRRAREGMDESRRLLEGDLTRITRAIESARDAESTATPVQVETKAADNASVAAVFDLPLPMATPAAAAIRTVEVDKPAGHAALLRWASGAILFALLIVCVWILNSVVKPIRAFASTIAQLSRGDLSVRFEQGGIRELDGLAEAFNHMGEELVRAQARTKEYQSELEKRVDERTRQLQHLADHDVLTALPNRRQLACYLDLALERAAASGRRVGVFFLDLDNFKTLNDSMGHAYGDTVLQAIAQRLLHCLPPGGFAARLGGDEFTVIVEASSPEEVIAIGIALAGAFEKPHLIEDRELVVGVSLGASIFPDHETQAAALLRAADAALFQAKSDGRSRLAVFEPALLEAAALKFRIEQGLRRALERGEFELLFQPEASFGRMDACLVEALLRWRRPDGQYVLPGEFLLVAEESGLIMTISDWVVRSAVEQAASWYHGKWRKARVAINVSARQLLDARFDERLAQLLAQYDLPPSCIEIELTENVLQTGDATIAMLHRLRKLGISIALDDFGTGYSSLASIEKLPLTRVKLDRSLIAEIDRQPRSRAIAHAIIALCRDIGLEVTAEGVERPEQLALLAAEPVLNVQGYLLSPPVPPDAIPELVARMPDHLQSLLLTVPATRTALRKDASADLDANDEHEQTAHVS
jgi:diguanylate cyclase (GGDEF)-like protein